MVFVAGNCVAHFRANLMAAFVRFGAAVAQKHPVAETVFEQELARSRSAVE